MDQIIVKGPLIGSRVAGINVRLQDGETHAVDSTEIAMINTMMNMMREGLCFPALCYSIIRIFLAFEKAQWSLLEPIMKVDVTVPTEYQGAIVNSLTQRNAIVGNTELNEEYTTISAEVFCLSKIKSTINCEF